MAGADWGGELAKKGGPVPLGQWSAGEFIQPILLLRGKLLCGKLLREASQGSTMYRICETTSRIVLEKTGIRQMHPQCLEELV